MELNDPIELTKIALLAWLLLFCSATDLSMRRVPNAVLLPTLLAALVLNSVDGGLKGLGDSVAGLVIGLVMLMPMHVLGRMGAGDVKLLGVVGSVLGGWGALVAGLATMMAGGILAVLYLLWLCAKPQIISSLPRTVLRVTGKAAAPPGDGMSRQAVRAAEIPYAVAIAAGTLATVFYLDILKEVSST